MKHHKLLSKTLRAYALFSLLILAISSPLFYLIMQHLYLDDADETLQLHKNEFVKYSAPFMSEADIATWNRINRDLKIEAATFPLKKDSAFRQFYYDTLDAENEPYRVLLAPVAVDGKSYHLRARLSMVESEDLLSGIALLFSGMLVVLLTGLYFIARYLSGRLWQPFYDTLSRIEAFEIDKDSRLQFGDTDIEEFHRLNVSLSRLAERNSIIYKSQQEFIENAAHELQTPLAVFQARLEILIQQSALTPEQAEVIGTLSDSASRLSRLNKNLLLLSKIDNQHYIGKEQIRFREIIEKQIGFFEEQAAEKQISLELRLNAAGEASSNPVLAEIVVSNLLLNAIRHNVEQGTIRVTLDAHSLCVSNTGHSGALLEEKLFLRFSRSGTVSHGSGLGLAILKKIADLNGWNISYSYRENFHQFSLNF